MQHWHRRVSLLVLFAVLGSLIPVAAPTRAEATAHVHTAAQLADLFSERSISAPSTRPTLRTPLLHQTRPAVAPLANRRSQQQATSVDPLARLQSALALPSQLAAADRDLLGALPPQALADGPRPQWDSRADERGSAHAPADPPPAVDTPAQRPPQPVAASPRPALFFPLVVSSHAQPEVTISPSVGGMLIAPDQQTTITFAPGAVTTPATARYTAAAPRSVPPSLRAVGAGFDLAAARLADAAPLAAFETLVTTTTVRSLEFESTQTRYVVTPTVTVELSYADHAIAGLDEASMRLYRQDEVTGAWHGMPSVVSLRQNLVQATIERAGRYALLAQPTAASLRAGAGAVEVQAAATPPVVVLDPDHGGADPGGFVSYPPPFAAVEKTYNLRVAQLLRDQLQACGVQVVLTREADSSVTAATRLAIINGSTPQAAITLAFNVARPAMGDSTLTGSGPEGWVNFSKAGDRAFAAAVNQRVQEFTGLQPRGVKNAATNPGGPIAVALGAAPRFSHSELAFMDNYYDRAIMDDPAGMGAIANGVFLALLDQIGGAVVCQPGFRLPDPLSAAERARLRTLGYQSWMRYRGDPVNTATGNMLQQFTDLAVPGVAGLDLVLQRTYNSLDPRDGRFGVGWSSLLDMSLRLANDGSVDVRYADGSGASFVADGDGFAPGQDGVFDRLARSGDDFVLSTPDQRFFFFDPQGRLTQLRDRHDNTIVFERDDAGRVLHVRDTGGRLFTLTYDGEHVAAIVDPLGRTLRYSYSAGGELIRTSDANGGERRFSYADQRMTTITDPEGIVYLQNRYDAAGRVIDQVDASGVHNTFSYDGGLIRFTDNLGHQTHDRYDERHRVTETRDALGHVERFVYSADDQVVSHTDRRGHTTTSTYDARGNLLSATDALGHTTSYTYSDTNDLTSVTDRGGPGGAARTTTYRYDARGNLTRIEHPDGTATRATYDDRGQLLALTDANGHLSFYIYDAAGNVLSATDALGRVTRFSYDAVGRQRSVTDANGHVAQFAYDANDNVTTIIDPQGQRVSFSYDRNDNLVRMTDRRGGVTTYAYDENLKLIRETDPEGHAVAYAYDALYNRISMTDARGNVTRYRYDAGSQLIDIENAAGGVTRFSYDPSGNVTQITDALGQVTAFAYDANDRLTTQTDALGGVTTFTYDAVDRLVATMNPRGATTTYAYDLLDRPILMRDALGGAWQTTYDAVGNITRQTDPNRHTITLRYDAADQLVEQIDAAGHRTQLAYDAVGNLIARTDALGRVSRAAYDANDNLAAVTDALGGVTRFTYDAEDQRVAVTDANGHTTRFTYDGRGLLIALIEAGGQTTTFAYDAVGNLVTRTNAKGNAWQLAYDAADRPVSETDPLGHRTRYGYDALGRLTHVIDGNGITTRYGYDALDRLTAVVQNDRRDAAADAATNVVTRYGYDSVGNLVSLIDANGEETTFGYDLLDRLTSEMNALGRRWQYTYDAAGNLQTRTDARGQITRYTYDATDQLTRTSYQDGTSIAYSYDAVGNQLTMTDALGTTRNAYDALDRLTATTNHQGQQVSYRYDAVGNRTSLTYPDGRTVRYEYDATDRERRVIDPDGNVFEVTRDATHNLTKIALPNQTEALMTFDAAERLTAVENLRRDGGLINRFAYTLDAVGNRTRTVAEYSTGTPRQLTTSYRYDPLDRLIRSEDDAGQRTEYRFDAVGNRLQHTTNVDPSGSRTTSTVTTTSTYDATNALISTVEERAVAQGRDRAAQTAQVLRAFVHEVEAQRGRHVEPATADDLLRQARALLSTLDGSAPPTQRVVAEALTALEQAVSAAVADGRIDRAGVGASLQAKLSRAGASNRSGDGTVQVTLYDYDANGNRIRRAAPDADTGNRQDWLKTEYAYDAENRLTQVRAFRQPHGGTWQPRDETRLTYDGYGRLVRRVHDQRSGGGGQQWVDYIYDGLDPIAEYLAPSGQHVDYHRGLDRILSAADIRGDGASAGGLHYYHYDGLGSVTGLTKHQGQRAHAYRYSDYGMLRDTNGKADDASTFTDPHNHYTYTGQEWDEQTGLLHFYAREYDPATGTWLQQDPYRGQLAAPTTLHRYGYVENNPATYVDKYGYFPWIPVIVIVAVVIDYGWTAWDAYNDVKVINDPEASESDKQVAAGDLALIIATEAAETDEVSPVRLPLDDLVRKGADKAFKRKTHDIKQKIGESILKKNAINGNSRYRERFEKSVGRPKLADHELHHGYPVKFANKFKNLGIDIDAPENLYELPIELHNRKPHGVHTGPRIDSWNGQWEEFFRANPNPSREQVELFRDKLAKDYGIEEYLGGVK